MNPGGEQAPRISILIVNFNGLKHLKECLDSLERQTVRDFETVLVDNGSKDASVVFLREHYPWVKLVISESNLGFAGGNNLGLAHCRGDYVFFLNNDVRVHPEAVEKLLEGIYAHHGINVFACFLIDFHDPEKVDSAGDALYTSGIPFSFSGFPVSRFTTDRPVTAACAGAAAYSRELLKKLKGFDEDFFLVFEDMDLSLRARHEGEKIVFLSGVKIYHKGSASMGGKRSPISFYHAERNLLWLIIKNHPLPSLLNTLKYYPFLKALRLVHAMRFGFMGIYFKANFDSLRKVPSMWKKRRAILKGSRITPSEFSCLLRPHWLRERVAIFRGKSEKLPT